MKRRGTPMDPFFHEKPPALIPATQITMPTPTRREPCARCREVVPVVSLRHARDPRTGERQMVCASCFRRGKSS